MNEVPLEEAEPAKKAFGDLTEGDREAVRDALAAIARDPAAGREIPGWRPPSVEYTYTPGMGVTVVYDFRDPQVVG
ncbi:hypothetical protein ACGF5O_21175 [Streptomyces sp. NPDC048291]|uniref:hypothetical protein n=1 Tax=Streptomyces sp. NPDC048291 TaxID=3365530 RepID=UPI00371ED8F3